MILKYKWKRIDIILSYIFSLSTLIKQAADNIVDFTTTWIEIVERGKYEGFTETELKLLILPHVKDQFRTMGMTEKQIANRVHYLFRVKEKNDEKKQSRVLKLSDIDHNNVLEDCSSTDWDKDSAMDEIARLQTDLNDVNETIRSMSFEENPDIIRINQADPNSMVFTKLKGSDGYRLSKERSQEREILRYCLEGGSPLNG